MGVWSERVGGPGGARRRYVATVSVIALAVGFSLTPAPTKAQEGVSGKSSRSAIAFNIPSQSLNSAILTYADRAGVQVFYDVQRVSGLRSSAVTGSYSREQALAQLLAGTGVTYSFSGNTVSLTNPASADAAGGVAGDGSTALQTIVIQGENPNSTMTLPEEYAGGQVATGGQVGMLGNRDVMNTPFSQSSFTKKKIEDQQAETSHDVLRADPSYQSAGNGGYAGDQYFIRGFQASGQSGSRTLNGLSGIAPLSATGVDMLERVELLKGPSSLLNGMPAAGAGALGGTVNFVTKQAGDEPLTELTTRYISRSQLGAHLDVGRRFGPDKQFGIRFNGTIQDGDTPIDTQSKKLGSAALNLDYRGERLRLSADIAHLSEVYNPENATTLNIGTVGVVPRVISSGTSLRPAWGDSKFTTTLAMIRAEADILDNVTVFGAIGAQRSETDRTGAIGNPTLLDATGRYRFSTGRNGTYRDIVSAQTGVRARVETGPVDHAISVNLTKSWLENGSATVSNGNITVGSIYDPVFGTMPTFSDLPELKKGAEIETSSIGFADTMSILDERIQLTAGLRYQQVGSTTFNATTGLPTSEYDSNAWTPAFGLVVKPWENVSLYANYIEDLQAGTIVGDTYANAGEVFVPYRSKQYEAGVKADWGAITTTLAVFQIAQPSEISIPDSGGGFPTLALDGEQRNRGIEFNAYGEVTDGVRLLGGVTLLDARLTKTQNGLYDGNRAQAAPHFRAVIGGEWDTPFMEGLTLTGRVTYTGEQVVSNTNENLKIPSWATVDLGARYTFQSPWNSQPVVVRFNVDNVFDREYWSTGYSGLLFRGDARTFRLSTTFKF